jgi:signal transduction histidine kinase
VVWQEGILRIVQEFLTNTIKHAKARNYSGALFISSEKVELHLADDGHGFDQQAETDGFGLVGMKERAQQVGAEFRICAKRGHGTEVFLTLDGGTQILLGKQEGES